MPYLIFGGTNIGFVHTEPVRAQQPNAKGLSIQADTQEANSKTGVITARTNVRLSYPDRKLQARANTAQYDIKGKQIILSGNVLVVQNGSSLQGETITYLIDEGRFVAKQKPGIPVQSIYVIPDKKSN